LIFQKFQNQRWFLSSVSFIFFCFDAQRIKKNLFRPYKQPLYKKDLALCLADTYFVAQSALTLVNDQW
jgi:hypothetical protein